MGILDKAVTPHLKTAWQDIWHLWHFCQKPACPDPIWKWWLFGSALWLTSRRCAIAGVSWRGTVSARLAWGDLLVGSMSETGWKGRAFWDTAAHLQWHTYNCLINFCRPSGESRPTIGPALRRVLRSGDGLVDRRRRRPGLRSVFIISNREISNWAYQILKANMLLICTYCLKFQIARV